MWSAYGLSHLIANWKTLKVKKGKLLIANLQISPDFPAHQKKSGWLYIWVVVVVVDVVVCTLRLGTRTNMPETEVE